MIGNTNGAKLDLYREQIWNNSSTYATNVSDDFQQNAVIPTTPFNTGRALCGAYGSQQTTRSWQSQLKQRLTQT